MFVVVNVEIFEGFRFRMHPSSLSLLLSSAFRCFEGAAVPSNIDEFNSGTKSISHNIAKTLTDTAILSSTSKRITRHSVLIHGKLTPILYHLN